jgi:hypothetical protein
MKNYERRIGAKTEQQERKMVPSAQNHPQIALEVGK